MIGRTARRDKWHWWIAAILMLAACGGEQDKDTPLPTVFNPDTLPSQMQTPPASLTAPLTPSPDAGPVAQGASPTMPPALPTGTLSPTVTPSLTPTPGSAQIEATGLALTNTAAARVLPFTQTVEAIRNATATAVAGFSPTPSLTPSPTLEPESYQVVYYTNRNGNDDIYLMTLNGDERALVRTAANEREPSCSPDGQTVVYASDASGSYQLYLLPLNSTQPVQLTNTAGMNFAPVFSADGSQIAFVSTRGAGGIPTIWVMNADGSNPQQVTTDLGRDTSPSWGPDGRQLLFSSDQLGPWDLFMTILEEEVEGEFPILPSGFNPSNQLWPVFDDQGERIAYTLWADLDDPQTTDIYLLDFEQEAPVPVREGPGADIAWAWGDENRLLASVGGPDDVQIALVDVTTGDAIPLTDTGTFNGGARLCTVRPGLLPPEPAPPASPTPSATPTVAPTATPAPTPTVSPVSEALRAAQGHPHVVQPGDTLMAIGYQYGVNWRDLAAINTLSNPDRLSVGQQLTVPYIRTGRPVGGPRPIDFDAGMSSFTRKEIVVELGQQQVKAFENGHLIKTVTVSTGLPDTPTVEGKFSIYVKRESQTMSGPGYYLPNVPWVMYFYQGYGLHGTYWHENFGEPMSHGCVNLPTAEARWFYQWAEIGTPVLVMK